MRAAIRALRHDLPEVNVAGMPLRPALALQELAPRAFERGAAAMHVSDALEQLADRRADRGRAAGAKPPTGR